MTINFSQKNNYNIHSRALSTAQRKSFNQSIKTVGELNLTQNQKEQLSNVSLAIQDHLNEGSLTKDKLFEFAKVLNTIGLKPEAAENFLHDMIILAKLDTVFAKSETIMALATKITGYFGHSIKSSNMDRFITALLNPKIDDTQINKNSLTNIIMLQNANDTIKENLSNAVIKASVANAYQNLELSKEADKLFTEVLMNNNLSSELKSKIRPLAKDSSKLTEKLTTNNITSNNPNKNTSVIQANNSSLSTNRASANSSLTTVGRK